jgi:Rrf2 family cysteine metabolism transcriptional repressor
MKFSTKERYGLQVMVGLCRQYGKGPTALSQIAEAEGLSLPYLEQVVIPLRQAGLLQSIRGAHGGYTLAHRPEAISAGEVIRAVEGALFPMPCVRDELCTPCERENTCAARNVWELVHKRLVDALDAMSLADLCRFELANSEQRATGGDPVGHTGPSSMRTQPDKPWEGA